MLIEICPCRINPNASNSSTNKTVQPFLIEENKSRNVKYSECCQPLHEGLKQAQDAEMLMRSRYSAFVNQNVDYIVETTLPAQQQFLDELGIRDWAKNTNWAGLEIVDFSPKISKRHAQVEFNAFYTKEHEKRVMIDAHHERSIFVYVKSIKNPQDARWYFLDPTVPIRVTQKQPCICGSGEKFKRCCGKFI